MSAVGLGGVLLAIWVLLWGSLTWANVLGGLAVAVVLRVIVRDERPALRMPTVRVVPAAQFMATIVVHAVKANWMLAREVVARRPTPQTGFVDVPLPRCSDGLLTVLLNVMSLTPGTMPVSISYDPEPTVRVHVLNLRSAEAVRREIQRLAALAVRAFGHERPSEDTAP